MSQRPQLGDYVEIEVGKGNFFRGFVTKLIAPSQGFARVHNYDVLLDKTETGGGGTHQFTIFQLKEIFTKEDHPEYYL